MAHSSSIETKQMLYVLHGEERRLIEALSAVRTKLNDLKPISRLPAEILEGIFEICVSWLYEHRKAEHRLAWTQVCRKWRFISLNAAHLWRCIDLCDSRLAHEFLLRSGSAPIHLISKFPSRVYIGDLQTHAERVKSLDVYLFPEDLINLFASFGPDLENLTSLSLRVPPVSTNFVLNVAVRIPRLKRLALEGVSIPWNLCVGLTHLFLRALGSGYSPSLAEIRTIFESSPNLEYIRLGCISPALHLSTPPPKNLIPLPRLRELIIAAKAPIILSILSSISLPPSARLQANCSQFESLDALFPSRPGTMYTALDIRAVRLEREGVRLFRSAVHLENPADSIVSFGSVWSISKRFLPDVPRFFDLTHVTALELGAAIDLPGKLLESFLASLPALEDLRVAFSASLTDLVLVLSSPHFEPNPTSHTHESGDGHNLLCPRLRTISFGRTSDEVWWDFEEEWLPLFLKLAEARHRAGIPLEVLEFMRCNGISLGMCEDFAGLVGRISVVSVGFGRDGELVEAYVKDFIISHSTQCGSTASVPEAMLEKT